MVKNMIKISEKKIHLTCIGIALSLGLCFATVAKAAAVAGDETTTSAQDHGEQPPNINPLSFDPDLALFTALVFFCLLLLLWKFAWGPILTGLAAREDGIAANIDQAKQDAEAAMEKLRQYEERLAASAEEARTIIAKAHADAQAVADKIRGEAEDAAKRQRDRAVKEIELATEQALQGLADHVAQNVFQVAGKVLSREVRPEDHRQLIQESIKNLPSKN